MPGDGDHFQGNINTSDILVERKFKRGQIKSQITRFSTFLDGFDTSSGNFEEIQVRLDKTDGCLELFNDIQSEIERTMGAVQDDERDEFEFKFYKTIGRAKKMLADFLNARNQNSVAFSNINTANLSTGGDLQGPVKLPPIKLTDFHGTYSQWLTFHDIFNSLVHSNTQLNNIQKFWYLKSCLKGEAAQLVQSLEISDSNYNIAWGMLKERYENKRLIVHTHIKGIFDIVPLKNESFMQLRSLLDNFNKSVRALTSLGQPTDNWDTLLIYVLTSKLDTHTQREWEDFLNKNDIDFPTVIQITDFLTKKCNFLETIEAKNKLDKGHSTKSLTHVLTGKITCAFCNKNHLNFHCEKITRMHTKDLYTEIKKHKLCLNCLRPFHDQNACQASGCKHCGRKHNTLLHSFYNTPNAESKTHNKNEIQRTDTLVVTDAPSEISDNANTNLNMHSFSPKNKQIILATALINLIDSSGNIVQARAILDSASQSNFMTNSLAQKLKLKTQHINVPVAGINNSCSRVSNRVSATFLSTNNKYKRNDMFLLVDKITENLPQTSFDISNINIPGNLHFADKDFNLSRPVDVLLGVNVFFEILCVGQHKLGKTKPILHKTKLGWILTGNLSFDRSESETFNNKNICNFTITNNELSNQIEKFWILENLDTKNKEFLPEELACERHFTANYKRLKQGRIQVSLPVKNNVVDIGDSKNNAIKRFYSLERRLQKDEGLRHDYCNFMREYENLGHMSVINDEDTHNTNLTYYLPHHNVMKTDSTTTKLRVVFDASAKSDTGISLNDVLMTGPVLQRDLLSITLNFRFHNVVLTGDIEKMYRQVQVSENDRQLQRIVWRPTSHDELRYYTLNTVTYGTAPASFLAIRSLNQAAIENADRYPTASKTILTSFYVDDLLTGADTIEEMIELKNQIVEILSEACFPLRKFYSNKREVLIDCDRGQLENYDLSEDKTRKTLGLFWQPNNDTFNLSTNLLTNNTSTKREILSVIAKIFDPMGLVGPVTVRAKIIMQRLWQCKVGWDESIPVDIYTLWQSFFNQLSFLGTIKIPRQVTIPDYVSIEMHGFCDASEAAYGACIYIITTDQQGLRHSRLLCAKSRIAPLKTISLPRLELCGALLLATLSTKVENCLDVNINSKHFWCDSTITLAWIAGEPNSWNTFVANRVTQIHELTDKAQWRHVSSSENSADLLSRGTNPRLLSKSYLWWNGPEFLQKPESYWPTSQNLNFDNIPDKRKTINLSFMTQLTFKDQTIFDKFSNFQKLLRVFAYVLRFIHNINPKNKTDRKLSELTQTDLDLSLNTLIKMVQWSEYCEEISCLKNHKRISGHSKLISLNPFIDGLGILRVGGRIRHSNLTPDVKHPILLPPRHNFTKLLIRYEHYRNLHAATQSLLSIIRNEYWIVHGKGAIKRVIRQCLVCFKANPPVKIPMMGDLPQSRLLPARPFLTVGCDFAGPIMIKDGKLRSRKIIKSYFCIFICFVTRAIHIELVGDLSTESFLNSLKRFAARRGLPKDIHSDNGRNFVGANAELKGIFSSVQESLKTCEVRTFLLENDIKWHFIPPHSPAFGGIWEAAVKSTKYHLTRILREAYLTFESLSTVLCQIEAILNSRPLTPFSDDPNDLSVLTPSHFLIGDLLTSVPQRDVMEVSTNRLGLYERLQQLVQHFWKRWAAEYLTSLQVRSKWRNNDDSVVKLGTLVILREDNVPPQQWILGRIIDVHPGKDSVIRVVSVKTKTGVFKRAVSKISVLPIEIGH